MGDRNELQMGGVRGPLRLPIQLGVTDISKNASMATGVVPADLQLALGISFVCGETGPDGAGI